jgi:two-component system, NtrC family, sensor histidine kinase HydH
MAAEDYFQNLKDYVGFTEDSSAVLKRAHAHVGPHVAGIIDDFYDTIEAHPDARKAITGGHAQIERLKHSLRRWLEELLVGPHDDGYFERRARIGRVHVRIALPQAYMFTAMNRIRVRVQEVLRVALANDQEALGQALLAVHQIMDVELAVMLETYREDLEAKNRRAERLATIGEFAAGIGHELRNPLGVVESSVFLLRQYLQKVQLEPKAERHLDKITTEVKRSNETINSLLELARNRPPRPQVINLLGLLRSARAAANLPGAVSVDILVAEDAEATLDPEQITRVLTNLLINASQAMGGQGRVWMEAQRSASETLFRVRDSGPGVAPEVRPRIFEALFTTKAKGSGLGLALCRRIAESHGGTIVLEVDGPEATGATFVLTVPDRDPGKGAT